jgi:4-amino-4-deoxy-L-arabinose transferase-like glycosyltransferase
VLYRDRYTFIGPLAYEAMGVLVDGFGPGLLVGRIAQALVFALTAVAVYGILREFTGVRWASLGAIACLPLKPLAFPLGTIPNYSQLAMLLSLGAVAAGLRFLATGRNSWLAASGLAVGLTVVAKQSLGGAVAAAVAASVALDAVARRQAVLRGLAGRAWVLGAATSIPILGTLAFYGSQGALGAFVDRAAVGLLAVAPGFRVPPPPSTWGRWIPRSWARSPSGTSRRRCSRWRGSRASISTRGRPRSRSSTP